ncbi:MAG: ATP-grasp domain-containing protein [Desulfobacula sp.]|jgi:D-alanine-D-alanine ligase|uniref:ATP-grasp domain-containing protein n=1 Tax=Desulfobacula sp. TaxID=2593537 RepID=UPI001D1B5439|nr:ATP-grasp domain-containing protein [Desulfobacula sp.]MBT3487276.1 ATP-grasp domain-containing protein [Desulfobacula sp.]MBT3806360.1 ATP-grasp domain-containing protein [Desulfobacula sp.]MBT4025923.1 ATP-grasp domain-containing protein [Desulfobacula sp.]MBT4200922.1 ATP-grasp domain-containing protein [Desulfobacula sp.]
MKKILLITGPAGDAQGWGDLKVTQSIKQAIDDSGKSAQIAFVNNMAEFYSSLEKNRFDIAWSALYHISEKSETIGMNKGDEKWVADVLDDKGIPYIGPDAQTMKNLIHKTTTHKILNRKKISVPYHYQLTSSDALPDIVYPAFVKPSYESRSVGISDESVVNSPEELKKRIDYIENGFEQPALVEEYLPGDEYTVLMLGNGAHQVFLPGKVVVDPSMYGKYPILRSDLRGVGVTKIKPVLQKKEELIELCRQAMEALNCLDHVRADMRLDADDKMKIIEVNGIPGLKPVKSWSPQIFSLNYPSSHGPMEDYRKLIDHIVSSALSRYNIE